MSAWSYKAGEKGRNRVRAYRKAGAGTIYLEYYERDSETGVQYRKRVSTGHSDREHAKRQADKLAADFAAGTPQRSTETGTTLRGLFDKYQERRSPQVGERQRKHHERCAEMFCRHFGWCREASSLNRQDWDRFWHDRATGAIDARGNAIPAKERAAVSARTVKRDLQALRAALGWAVGADLLEHNPCARYPFPKVPTPKRPRISQDRYEAMLAVARDVDWRSELALILANETGHRIRAIRHLRWSDIDLAKGLVTWRGDLDKIRNEHSTPLTRTAIDAFRRVRAERAAIGDSWVLPSPHDPSDPASRNLVRDWWYRMEKQAELDHIPGLAWHGLRRKYADEHRHVPVKDLADLGGWKTPRTILEVYQGSDLDAMRQAQARRQAVGSGE